MEVSEVISQIHEKLPVYLESLGVEINGNNMAKCPVHDDTNASMHVNGNLWHCFGCGAGGNIFTLASLMEGLPGSKDPGFFQTTVQTLADRYNIEYEYKPKHNKGPSLATQIKGVYRMVFNALTLEGYEKQLAERGIDPRTARMQGIGWVDGYEFLLKAALKEYGKYAVGKAGLFNKELYNNHRMLFTLTDIYGTPIGFSGRVTNLSQGEDLAKYINSPNNEAYNKGKSFYNLCRAKHYDTLYLMEGQMDVVTAVVAGIPNSIGALSNNLAETQLKMLMEFDKIVIAFDSDKGGITKARNLLSHLPNATAILMPEGADPDSFILEFGKDAFLQLEEYDAFGFGLATGQFSNTQHVIDVVKKIAQANPMWRSRYIELLAQSIGDSVSSVRASVHYEDQLYQRQRLAAMLQKVSEVDTDRIHLTINVGTTHEDSD
jgi:DNA primase